MKGSVDFMSLFTSSVFRFGNTTNLYIASIPFSQNRTLFFVVYYIIHSFTTHNLLFYLKDSLQSFRSRSLKDKIYHTSPIQSTSVVNSVQKFRYSSKLPFSPKVRFPYRSHLWVWPHPCPSMSRPDTVRGT